MNVSEIYFKSVSINRKLIYYFLPHNHFIKHFNTFIEQ